MIPPPPIEDFISILYRCSKERSLIEALRFQIHVCNHGLESYDFIVNPLVSTFVSIGNTMCYARQMFDKLLHHNDSCCNSLICGYAKHKDGEEALVLYQQMLHQQFNSSFQPSTNTFVALLKVCAQTQDIGMGCKIHEDIVRKMGSVYDRDPFMGSALVGMYAKCGSLHKAEEVFDLLEVRNVVAWNSLISGYVGSGDNEKVLSFFYEMQYQGISPDVVTFICTLKACGKLGSLLKGEELHAEIVIKALEVQPLVGNSLINMYIKLGCLCHAQQVFDTLPLRTLVSWTTIISGYTECGEGKKALYLFDKMEYLGFAPDEVTYICSLKACGSIQDIEKGQNVHLDMMKKGFLLRNSCIVASTLVDMYVKCGFLAEAENVFNKLVHKDIVLWTVLISGYVEQGYGEKALHCFRQMQREGSILIDIATLVCILKACGGIGAFYHGHEIHSKVIIQGWESDLCVGSSLVDMYANCGLFEESQLVFDKVLNPNVMAWSSLIALYTQLGESEIVCITFDRMVEGGIKPDLVTLLSVLNACNHGGLVEKGIMYFEAINEDYGYVPALEHYACIIDLLSRAGRINEAMEIVKKMPIQPKCVLWHIVLANCQKWGNVELGRHTFAHAMQLDDEDSASYIYMSNIFVDVGAVDNAT